MLTQAVRKYITKPVDSVEEPELRSDPSEQFHFGFDILGFGLSQALQMAAH
jgi:hypothetical protein